MKLKGIVTAALLLFVIASVGYLVAREAGGAKTSSTTSTDPTAPPPATKDDPAGSSRLDTGTYYVITYFHGTKRCNTCRTLEAYSHRAIEDGFADELRSGNLRWRSVNYDLRENEHFLRDFGLDYQALVIEEKQGSRRLRWKNLDRIWNEVGSQYSFEQYVQQEVSAFMEKR